MISLLSLLLCLSHTTTIFFYGAGTLQKLNSWPCRCRWVAAVQKNIAKGILIALCYVLGTLTKQVVKGNTCFLNRRDDDYDGEDVHDTEADKNHVPNIDDDEGDDVKNVRDETTKGNHYRRCWRRHRANISSS